MTDIINTWADRMPISLPDLELNLRVAGFTEKEIVRIINTMNIRKWDIYLKLIEDEGN